MERKIATPPLAPLEMPTQDFRKEALNKLNNETSLATLIARFLAFFGAIVLGSIGTQQMFIALSGTQKTLLQWILLILFAITFFWVSFSATSSLVGLLPILRRKGGVVAEEGKFAIVMPVYGEDPTMTGATLLALAESLKNTSVGHRAELFIISDTQDADFWVRETAAFQILKTKSPLPVFYRRREKNIGRKAGNVEDFVKRWGGRYEYMLMLDADSVMSANSIIQMVARMDSEPNLGLLQTAPQLVGGESFLSRSIQFASALYGKIVAKGVNAWQGTEGNYWGHNALIRISAFAQSCGLPVLKGRRPIGGHIMSHDFVEAALLVKHGWQVRMDSDISGSFEGLPPTLEDLATRERRWAQGNLQHLGIMFKKGLKFPNRMHFAIGILGYLMSPIWLLMLTVGLLITAQTLFIKPQYFPVAYQLFPNWPVFDADRMKWLFFAALGLLFLPKFMGYFAALFNRKKRRLFGGAYALTKGFIAEMLISCLYAPMLMLIQTHHIIDIFLGRDSGWKTQSRSGDLLGWKESWAKTWLYVVFGFLPLLMLSWLAPDQIVWLSPVVFGLLFSPLLIRHSGNVKLGKWLEKHRTLLIPAEIDCPTIFYKTLLRTQTFAAVKNLDLAFIVSRVDALKTHIAVLDYEENSSAETQEDFLIKVCAKAKIEAAKDINQALEFLTAKEKLKVAGTPELLAILCNKAK